MNLNNSKDLQDSDIPVKTIKVNLDISTQILWQKFYEIVDQTEKAQKAISNLLNLSKVLERFIYNHAGN